MAELLDFNKKTLIPPYEDLTFEVLRNLLVKIVNTLYHHTNIQNQILSTFNEEFKIRPTYSEIVDFVCKRSEPEDSDKTFVALNVMHEISNELERKVELTTNLTNDNMEDNKLQLKAFREFTMESFRRVYTEMNKHSEERKNVIKFVRNVKIIQGKKNRLCSIFTKWKNIVHNKKKSRELFKKIFKKKDIQRVKRGWNRLRGAYLLMRMKKFEGNSVKALLRADDCQNKLLSVLPEILAMKQNKANTEDLLKLAGAVQRTNYESVFKDLAGMIKEDTNKLNEEVQMIQENFISQLKDFEKQLKAIEISMKNHEGFKEMSTIKVQLGSLSNNYLLLNEKIARIDYCNKKEDNEFKLEVLTKQIQQLENRMLNISSSQDNLQDQAVYLRSMLQSNRPTSKTTFKMSSTAATRIMDQTANTSQVMENDLNVSGFYLKPSKRVASANPGKQRIFSNGRKHHIPTSFSSSLSCNDSPQIWFNKGMQN
ncbi:hypothetical protein SteCoe_21290 [Stentor coeruleus]|uniref:Uncharacterized protein n=1 Tax=Stentor coeruleus TaxID=5963 RepID=A0A1R2BPV7_9CILI|nr:hypothetical protein SteCoe_21290 [Stentor coeruleus]